MCKEETRSSAEGPEALLDDDECCEIGVDEVVCCTFIVMAFAALGSPKDCPPLGGGCFETADCLRRSAPFRRAMLIEE